MKVPKTPKEFDYDLWTEDGKYFMRIKRTGEQCEIDHETMRFLRYEEKRLRREKKDVLIPVKKPTNHEITSIKVSLLSLEQLGEDYSNQELGSHEEAVLTDLMEENFRETLTEKQLDIYKKCIKSGVSYTDYAKSKGITEGAVRFAVQGIRKKAKIFFQ